MSYYESSDRGRYESRGKNHDERRRGSLNRSREDYYQSTGREQSRRRERDDNRGQYQDAYYKNNTKEQYARSSHDQNSVDNDGDFYESRSSSRHNDRKGYEDAQNQWERGGDDYKWNNVRDQTYESRRKTNDAHQDSGYSQTLSNNRGQVQGDRRGDSDRDLVAPTNNLILRNLHPITTEKMIADALAGFWPTHIKLISNKSTGECKGFGFIEFASVEGAVRVVEAFAHQPLEINHCPVKINYSEDRGLGNKNGTPAFDWICETCNVTNFARRTACFKCQHPKTSTSPEVPQQNNQKTYNELDIGAPNNILVVRSIPFDATDEEFQAAFSHFPQVRTLRLMRDKHTNASRGFGFVEFDNIEDATIVINMCKDLKIHGYFVRVTYARDPPTNTRGPPPAALNPLAAAALQQAQWSLYNDYVAQQVQQQQPYMIDVVQPLPVDTKPKEPKNLWPPPFEQGGLSYVYENESGFFYDKDSMFYYYPSMKLYYNSYTGLYYQHIPGSDPPFIVFIPNPPANDEIASSFSLSNSTYPSVVSDPDVESSKVKKTGQISFGLKMAAPISKPTAPNKKHAKEIEKWSQIQKEGKEGETVAPLTSPTEKGEPQSSIGCRTTSVACLLCRRKFSSLEQLHKHETLSKLHKENLEKANKANSGDSIQYRDRAQERRDIHGTEEVPKPETHREKRKRVEMEKKEKQEMIKSTASIHKPIEESSIGSKMLRNMGWQKGKGLGKNESGITAPVNAFGKPDGETSGLGASTLSVFDPQYMMTETVFKNEAQRKAAQRFEAVSRQEE